MRLAAELKLTDMQRCFAEALAADPDRNQTKAAITAGASRKFAHERASKWASLGKVQRYLGALTAKAYEKAKYDADQAVADLAEVLRRLTAQMRGRAGDFITLLPGGGYQVDIEAVLAAPHGLIKKVRYDVKGGFSVELESSHEAAKTLLAYFTANPLDCGRDDLTIGRAIDRGRDNLTIGRVIDRLPGDLVAQLFRALALASGRPPAESVPPSARQ